MPVLNKPELEKVVAEAVAMLDLLLLPASDVSRGGGLQQHSWGFAAAAGLALIAAGKAGLARAPGLVGPARACA